MTYIKDVKLTCEEALELEHRGFILYLIKVGIGKDQYAVYAQSY
jgi:hypothetical protein